MEKAPSGLGSLEAIESDIQYANLLAASLSRAKGCACLQMKLAYSHLAPIYLFLLQWIDCSCLCLLHNYLSPFHVVVYMEQTEGRQSFPLYGRKATVQQFYDVILPSLAQLHDISLELESCQDDFRRIIKKKTNDNSNNKHSDYDLGREEECGICLEPCTRMVLPNCCHSMCINCYRDWNMRSESCPFCRGGLKRVNSGDLWVMTCKEDIVKQEILEKEEVLRFYLYVNSLPKDIPEALFLFYYEHLI